MFAFCVGILLFLSLLSFSFYNFTIKFFRLVNKMEYEFSRDPVNGGYHAKFSMEHEVFSAWLVDEVGNDAKRIGQLFATVEKVRGTENVELSLQGREYILIVNDLDVILELNSNCDGVGAAIDEFLPDENMSVNTDNYRAECGLDDFSQMLTSWQAFLSE